MGNVLGPTKQMVMWELMKQICIGSIQTCIRSPLLESSLHPIFLKI